MKLSQILHALLNWFDHIETEHVRRKTRDTALSHSQHILSLRRLGHATGTDAFMVNILCPRGLLLKLLGKHVECNFSQPDQEIMVTEKKLSYPERTTIDSLHT